MDINILVKKEESDNCVQNARTAQKIPGDIFSVTLPLPSVVQLETLTFPSTTALQRKLSIRRAVARLCPG